MADADKPQAKRKAPVVDIHTHMYPPEYISLLASRDTIPLVRTFPSSQNSNPDPRLILLEAELPALERALSDPSAPVPGRPLTRHFASLPQKLHFMATHNIDISILSLANPWLDFLPADDPDSAASTANHINASFESMCAAHPGKLYFFAVLPLTAPVPTILAVITSLPKLPHCRGIILGTSGLGSPGTGTGLDDPSLLPIFSHLAQSSLPIFLHPHYGLPPSVFGPRATAEPEVYGHVLPLAVGFPVETTVALARMYLAGVFDAVPGLRLILAHAGGALPFLAGRIESCVAHDAGIVGRWEREEAEEGVGNEGGGGGGSEAKGQEKKMRRTVWEVLREQVYLDAVVYSEVGLKAAVEACGGGREGAERLMFGTDHPFFPPVGREAKNDEGEWESVRLNVDAVNRALGEGSEEAELVMGGNAARVLRLYEE